MNVSKPSSLPPFPQDQPACYRIEVAGTIGEELFDWFEEMVINVENTPDGNATTCLSGIVADQSGLRGILSRLFTLGFPVISVTRIGYPPESSVDEPGGIEPGASMLTN